MTGTILQYLKEYGDVSFQELPINDVDSLILCQMAYLKYDGLVCDVRAFGPSVSLEEIAQHVAFDRLFSDTRYEKNNRALFQAALSGRRYRHMKLNCYINLLDKERELQFSAVTFLLEDGTVYVAFRGTDETIVGWKEDFNMAYLSPIPAQVYSVKYLNMVSGRLHSNFYVGGHSKGGNLAVYSAMNCMPAVQDRILKIYSMDGPGFRPEILERGNYARIQERVVKILPHSSLVGMLFEQGIRYKVVESNRLGLAQHDPYTWLVKKGKFVPADTIYESRRMMDSAINQWILSLDEQKLRTFIDTFYQVVSASEAEDLIVFMADWKKSVSRILSALREVDDETAEMIKEIFRSLFEITKDRMTPHFPPRKRREREEAPPAQE